MSNPRLPRFTRSRTIGPIQVTARDRAIVQLVNQHRFIRSSQILALIGTASPQVLRRLQLLYHHGFLERPRAQLDYYHRGGSRHIVYGIGNKGAALLKSELGIPCPDVHSGEKNRAVGRVFLEHALLVSDVMVAFELACRERNGVSLLSPAQLALELGMNPTQQPFQWKVTVDNNLQLGLVPDRVFGLEYGGPSGNNERAFFFLEADRGTMPVRRQSLSQTSFYRKLIAYRATWAQSIHRRRFGFHRFRVLTVTTSTERLATLIDACSELNSGHGLFLFAHRSVLDRPTDILSGVWHSPKHGGSKTLLT